MKAACLNCGEKFEIVEKDVMKDILGLHVECCECHATFDLEENFFGWKYKLFIYNNDNINSFICEKRFNEPSEIEDMLKIYEGYWCRIVDLSTLKCKLEGAFDDSYLDNEYYVA